MSARTEGLGRAGDQDRRARLVNSHIGIAHAAAKKWQCRTVPFEDLLQVGLEAMWAGTETHDSRQGDFGPYAHTIVRRAIMRELARMEHPGYALPRRVWLEAIGASSTAPWARSQQERRLAALRQSPVSLNAGIGDDDLIHFFAVDHGPEATLSMTDLLLYADLSPEELVAAELARIGMPDERQYALVTIAAALGVSQRTLSRLIAAARRALRAEAAAVLGRARRGPQVHARFGRHDLLDDLWAYETRHLTPAALRRDGSPQLTLEEFRLPIEEARRRRRQREDDDVMAWLAGA